MFVMVFWRMEKFYWEFLGISPKKHWFLMVFREISWQFGDICWYQTGFLLGWTISPALSPLGAPRRAGEGHERKQVTLLAPFALRWFYMVLWWFCLWFYRFCFLDFIGFMVVMLMVLPNGFAYGIANFCELWVIF